MNTSCFAGQRMLLWGRNIHGKLRGILTEDEEGSKNKMIVIREAHSGEEHEIIKFYECVIDQMQDSPYPLRWKKGVYPVLEDIIRSIDGNAMYVAEEDGCIRGAFVINHTQGEGYDLTEWKVKAEKEQVAVLHLLATLPSFQGKGIGRRMLEQAARVAGREKDTVIRLDTLPWNVPGKKLYEKFGFVYCGDVVLDYPVAGKIAFSMYEYELRNLKKEDNAGK